MTGLAVLDLRTTGHETTCIEELLRQPRWSDEEFKRLKAFLNYTQEERQQALEAVAIEGLLAGKGIHFPTNKRTPQIPCFLQGHADNTASMTLYRRSNQCYCFGCRRRLNTIDVLVTLEGHRFSEAMDYLLGDCLRLPAQLLRRQIRQRLSKNRTGVEKKEDRSHLSAQATTLPVSISLQPTNYDPPKEEDFDFDPTQHQPEIQTLLAAAVEYYHLQLRDCSLALDYLAQRGLTEATVEKQKLGYASGLGLVGWLRQHGLDLWLAHQIGLLGQGVVERLAGRVILPFFDQERRVAMLTSRIFSSQDGEATDLTVNGFRGLRPENHKENPGPKYLNLRLPKPPFDQLLSIEEYPISTLLLVEGPFDYLAAQQWGYKAICTWGTAIGNENLAWLKKALERGQLEQLLICFDNDQPRIQADGTVLLGAGPEAIQQLLATLASTKAAAIELPAGFKDVASLAEIPDGRKLFDLAVNRAVNKEANF